MISHDNIPIALSARIGGFAGPSYAVKIVNGALRYYHNPSGFIGRHTDSTHIDTSNDQWISFRNTLEEINIWSWDESYLNPDIVDGTSWNVQIKYNDKSIESGGSNATPPEFHIFLKAVSELVGGKTFR